MWDEAMRRVGSFFSSARQRFGPLAGVIAAQAAASLVGLLAGIVTVRLLEPGDYALYVLAASICGALSVLADPGLSAGFLAVGGRVWQNPSALGAVARVAEQLRPKSFARACLLVAPVSVWLLWRQGAGWGGALLWTTLAAGTAWAMGTCALREVPLRLAQRLRATQGTSLGQAALRLALTAGGLKVWPSGFLALAVTWIAQTWANVRLRRLNREWLAGGAEPDPAAEVEIRALMRRSLPGAIYFVVSAQLGLWILGLLAEQGAVAEFGALGRITLVLSVLASVNQAIFAPRFARLAADGPVRPAFFRALAVIAGLGLPLQVLAWARPEFLLWVLGPDYTGLTSELRLALFGATLQVLTGVGIQLLLARGWVMPPWLSIGLTLVCQVVGVALLDLATLRGGLWLSVVVWAPQLVLVVGYFLWSCRGRLLRRPSKTVPL